MGIRSEAGYLLKAYFEYTDAVESIGYLHLVDPVFTTDEALLCRAEAYALKARLYQCTSRYQYMVENTYQNAKRCYS